MIRLIPRRVAHALTTNPTPRPMEVVTILTPAVALGGNRMHLVREREAFEFDLPRWMTTIQLAHVTGGWTPLGTDAPFSSAPPVHGAPIHYVEGHYVPRGQVVAAADARALAQGIRHGLARMPGKGSPAFRDGVQERTHEINDPRLCEFARRAGAPHLVWASVVALDLERGAGAQLADFLARGSCRLMLGRPVGAERDEIAERATTERRSRLLQERDRLIVAIREGIVTTDEARQPLAQIRRALDEIDAGTPAPVEA